MSATFQASTPHLGENLSVEESSTENTLVDLFFQLVRSLPETTLTWKVSQIMDACFRAEDSSALADLFVLCFQTRDCRGGKGEKKLFYYFFLELYKKYPETVLRLLDLLQTYGYGKDLIALYELCESNPDIPNAERLADKICSLFAEQLLQDKVELETCLVSGATPRLSLLGKYAPRHGCAHTSFRRKLTQKIFGDNHEAKKSYRQLVVSLSAKLQVPETFMCTDRYDEIDFKKVPSLCLNRNRKAFLNEKAGSSEPRYPNNEKRRACRENLIASAVKGEVTGKVLLPHELVTKVGMAEEAESLIIDAQWSKIKEGVAEQIALFTSQPPEPGGVNLGKLCPLVDVSGSMSGEPMEVAIALGIMVSELSDPAFRDRFITFEDIPRWVSFEGKTTLKEKVALSRDAPWGGSTNFASAISMILDVAVTHKLTPDEIPDLIVFSDMQFNAADSKFNETMHAQLVRRFEDAGKEICGRPYGLPKIIYWNLRATGGFPVRATTPGTQLISGFSPSLLKLLFSGKAVELTPAATLHGCLDDERYNSVRAILSESKEGLLSLYNWTPPSSSSSSSEALPSAPSGGGGAFPPAPPL